MKIRFSAAASVASKMLIIIAVIILLASCTAKSDSDIIQIWWYDYPNAGSYRSALTNILTKISLYCNANNIPVEIVKYNEKMMSHDNYILKRNAAMATGNVILIDDARNLSDISNQHYDYSKIEKYDELMDIYKDRYCIPLGVGYVTLSVKNDIFNYYEENVVKDVITYIEYLELKQKLKDKGAEFLFNISEWNELTDHNLIKNNLYKIGDKCDIIDDEDKFKSTIKNVIKGIYDDYKLYYSSYSSIDILDEPMESGMYVNMYDTNSKIDLMSGAKTGFLTNYYQYIPHSDGEYDRSFILMPDYTMMSPCIYINERASNEKIHDIVNQMLDIAYYKILVYFGYSEEVLYSPYFSAVMDTPEVRKYAEVDENWIYKGSILEHVKLGRDNYILGVDRINEAHELLFKSRELSMQNADYYFSNDNYNSAITEEVSKLAKMLIQENMDYNDEKTDKILNKKIDEFIMNFYVHFN